ncbi:hypothetical protein VP01_339g4 [Puccinia sorghi]|uniref:Uncharacterized protein n=1 Tax=Puccinia sorghi TaxID=27349 RepID=A0A0L6UXI7_9BASI|nr:hypothetical protein VP01_339g4 [Puccinia sorghi]
MVLPLTPRKIYKSASNFGSQTPAISYPPKSTLRPNTSTAIGLLQSTIDDALLEIVDNTANKTPIKIYKLLKIKCRHSDQQDKLRIENGVRVAEIKSLKIQSDELLGLLIQHVFLTPIGCQCKYIQVLH